jgi:hypothetical protein
MSGFYLSGKQSDITHRLKQRYLKQFYVTVNWPQRGYPLSQSSTFEYNSEPKKGNILLINFWDPLEDSDLGRDVRLGTDEQWHDTQEF